MTLHQEEDYDQHKIINYTVGISELGDSNYAPCTEYSVEPEARSYVCDTDLPAQYVRITTTNSSVPLSVCEVAVYSLGKIFTYTLDELITPGADPTLT